MIKALSLFYCLAAAPIAYQTSCHLPTISQHQLAMLTVFPLSQSEPGDDQGAFAFLTHMFMDVCIFYERNSIRLDRSLYV